MNYVQDQYRNRMPLSSRGRRSRGGLVHIALGTLVLACLSSFHPIRVFSVFFGFLVIVAFNPI